MRTLVAAALVAYAKADATSLMQDLVKRSTSTKLDATEGKSNRQDSTTKLLETAVKMIKNGVTPDVITFVDSTNQEINEQVLVAIQNEHDTDQAYIDNLCQDFQNAIERLEEQAAAIAVHDDNRLSTRETHHECRAQEAHACAQSRRCEEQLRQQWLVVRREETRMREIHGHIHDEWCVHPPFFAEIDMWLNHPFDWSRTSPYPELNIPADVADFRAVSVTHFTDYMAQKIIVEEEWRKYNEKLVECSGFETALDTKVDECDDAQREARTNACEHAAANRAAREEFGVEWDRIIRLFNDARQAKTANEADRKAEWETLKIVQCLLDHVHSTVTESIETGAPCPTIDSDPDGVTLAIEDCHIVTRGCQEGSMTAHLCLNWCEEPPIPPLPPVVEPACTPTFIAHEQSAFLADIQASYTAGLEAPDATYPNDHLVDYKTTLSPAGWAGCAAPLVCVDCSGMETTLPISSYVTSSHTCHLHEEYLNPGQSNADTFKCLDGTCVSMAGRCNGVSNCADDSDEQGCDESTDVFVPAFLSLSSACPDDFSSDVYFQCANSNCIEKVGLCNGHDNCGDGSDETHCSASLTVTVESTSGRTITVETLQSHTGVFHDRSYNFDSLGDFRGKSFIKYSNDDKMTDHEHVMTKLRTLEPVTVFIVKLENHGLPWLAQEGYERTTRAGVSFSGQRSTHHKDWDTSLLTTDMFDASDVFSKTFPAGTISLPGNNAGDGSFLVFLEKPESEMPVILPVDQAPTGWRTINENWNCGGRGQGNHDSSHTGLTTNEACAEACYGEGFDIAAFWTNNNACRCYTQCDGGGPTHMPSHPNLVMQKTYHLVSADKKCPLDHQDRLFRSPETGGSGITIAECYRECANSATCAHFSFGPWDGGHVCMGCTTLANEQSHVGFNTYDMERSSPPVQMINNWDFEGMTTNGVSATLADGRWIHFTNSGSSGLSNTAILDWQNVGAGGSANGIYNPANNEVAEGTHVLFFNTGNDNNYVWQDLLHPFTADLHIEAAVGGGNGNSDGGYRMGLYTPGGALVQEVAAGVNGAPNTAPNGQYILTHLDVLTADHPDVVGQTLQLRLMKNKGGQGHFHYVRFT